jgi:chitinase
MATTGVFAHDSYGATLARTQSCGSPTQSIDENIAGNGSGDPTATFNQYVNSPPHLANLLDANMVSVGVSFEEGIYNDGTTTWPNFWMNTMTFASTADPSTPTPQPTPTPTPSPTGLVAPTVSLSVSGLAATFTVTGQATVPYYAVAYGDGTSASWQQGHLFSHTYTSAGTYGAAAWVGDGSTGQISPSKSVSVTVGNQPTPTPTPSPTPQPNACRQAYFLNGVLAQGGAIACP